MSDEASDSQRASGPPSTVHTVLIVDDNRIFAELLALALDTVDGMHCVATASTAADGVRLAVLLKPDVAIVDIQMPGQDGLTATRLIRQMAPATLIAMASAHSDPKWVALAAQAGADSFIVKSGRLPEMVDALHQLCPRLSDASRPFIQIGAPTASTPVAEQAPMLTATELDVLTAMGQGRSTRDTARELRITMHACRGVTKSLRQKLTAGSATEAVARGEHFGLIAAR